ncbi:MAG: restriction endonuclease [Rhodocyclaceae bacterium]|nr:restriction endonuclease [Rhodocyclaceae bacterium]MBX3669044.1 restriction endonuclease [Rhodocyclaceae bacterium]
MLAAAASLFAAAHFLLPQFATARNLSSSLRSFAAIFLDLLALGLVAFAIMRMLAARPASATEQANFLPTEQVTLAPSPTVLVVDDEADTPFADAPTLVVDTQQWLHDAHAPAQWSLGVLHGMEWKRFEDICPVFYREKGMRCEIGSLGPGAGIDLRLFATTDAVPTAIVRCRGWNARVLGADVPRNLAALMSTEKIGKGFVMGNGGFTDEARSFAAAHRINLVDLPMFLAMIERLPAQMQQRLLDFATAGDWTTPSCPACGGKMLPRHKGTEKFWSCPNFPRCRITCGKRAA